MTVATSPAKKPAAAHDLRYAGFTQAENVRSYRFDSVTRGHPSQRFVVTVDLALMLKHRIGVQEAPVLCMHKLAADLLAIPVAGRHELADDDLRAYASSRAAAGVRRRPKHSFAGRRGTPPPGPANQMRVT